MKIQKRMIAFLTAVLLILPLAGCLVPKDAESADPTASSGAVSVPGGTKTDSSGEGTPDGDAVAIELGDIKISVDEMQNTFDQYVSYFSYGYGTDEETLDEFMRMTEEWLIEFYAPEWKAGTLGIALSEEQEADCSAAAQEQVDEERDMLLCYYGDPEGTIEDASLLTDEQRDAALEEINGELEMMFGEGYTFDDYLSMRYDDALSTQRISVFSDLLEAQFKADSPVDEAAIDEWYDTTLAEQTTQFTEDPALFLDTLNGYSLNDIPVVLYAPERTAQLEVVCVSPDGSDDDRIEELALSMGELEAEYGMLKLRGEKETRQAEIEAEYAALREERETLETGRLKSAQKQIDSAHADLLGGLSFEEVMDAYNVHMDGESGRLELAVFLDGGETNYPALAEAASKLEPGAYSDAIEIDGEYYIVRLMKVLPKGAIDRASVENELNTTVRDSLSDEAWLAQQDAWLAEAKDAAVIHRDVYYDMLMSMYLG